MQKMRFIRMRDTQQMRLSRLQKKTNKMRMCSRMGTTKQMWLSNMNTQRQYIECVMKNTCVSIE